MKKNGRVVSFHRQQVEDENRVVGAVSDTTELISGFGCYRRNSDCSEDIGVSLSVVRPATEICHRWSGNHHARQD